MAVTLMHGKSGRSTSGFTLIEVMVALLVLGIALPALMAQIVAQLDTSAHLCDRILASWVAKDQLQRLQLQLPADSGVYSVQGEALQGERLLAGRTWFWRMEQEATAMPGMVQHTVNAGLEADAVLVRVSSWLASDVPQRRSAAETSQ